MGDTKRIIRTQLKAADMVLAAAESAGLPMPFDISLQESTNRVDFQFHTLAEVTEWSTWLDAPVTEETTGDAVHYRVHGVLFEIPVKVVAVVNTEPCSHCTAKTTGLSLVGSGS